MFCASCPTCPGGGENGGLFRCHFEFEVGAFYGPYKETFDAAMPCFLHNQGANT